MPGGSRAGQADRREHALEAGGVEDHAEGARGPLKEHCAAEGHCDKRNQVWQGVIRATVPALGRAVQHAPAHDVNARQRVRNATSASNARAVTAKTKNAIERKARIMTNLMVCVRPRCRIAVLRAAALLEPVQIPT